MSPNLDSMEIETILTLHDRRKYVSTLSSKDIIYLHKSKFGLLDVTLHKIVIY